MMMVGGERRKKEINEKMKERGNKIINIIKRKPEMVFDL